MVKLRSWPNRAEGKEGKAPLLSREWKKPMKLFEEPAQTSLPLQDSTHMHCMNCTATDSF